MSDENYSMKNNAVTYKKIIFQKIGLSSPTQRNICHIHKLETQFHEFMRLK